jgi:hypothetical protein
LDVNAEGALSNFLAENYNNILRIKSTEDARRNNNADALEHLVIPDATPRILFFKIDEKDYDVLKTFLCYLNLMPEMVYGINGNDISSYDIPLDPNVAKILLEI